MREYLMLVINPGSTSTKIAVFKDINQIFSDTLRHSYDELKKFDHILDQFDYRRKIILDAVEKAGINPKDFDAIIGRGGLLMPIPGGTYLVNEKMLNDLKNKVRGEHASNLGALIANSIATQYGISAYIVDPVSVDEMEPIARLSGMPENPRESLFHALNQKAVARVTADEMNTKYEKLNLIVAHLGGGISVAAHSEGRVIDVNNVIMGEGPFSPERAGTVPVGKLVEMCFSGKYSEKEIKKKLMGNGGLVAYLGTTDAAEIEKRINKGDKTARMVFEAMAYQIAKEIGACSAALNGVVDLIVLTGGLAHSKMLVKWIEERIDHIAQVKVYPGEMEMRALAEGCLRVLKGLEKAKIYTGQEIMHIADNYNIMNKEREKQNNYVRFSVPLKKWRETLLRGKYGVHKQTIYGKNKYLPPEATKFRKKK